MRSLFLAAAVIGAVAGFDGVSASAGTLYGVWYQSGHVEVFTVDPVTGQTTPLIATSATSLVRESTFDPVSKRLFFLADSDLYVVNVATRAVSHTHLLLGYPLQVDPATGVLYSLAYDSNSGQLAVASVDPATGAVTPIVPMGVTSVNSDHTAFDPASKRFFVVSSPYLYVVDIATKTVSHVDLGGYFPFLQFDTLTGVLYGIDFYTGGQYEVFSVNPTTGAMTPLATTGASNVGGPPSSTYDPESKRLFLTATPRLYVVNLLTGAVSYAEIGDNFPLLQYDAGLVSVPALTLPAALFLAAVLAAVGLRSYAAR